MLKEEALKSYTIWIHEPNFSKEEILVSPQLPFQIGDILLFKGFNLCLQITQYDQELLQKHQQLQISISSYIANLYDIPHRAQIEVKKVNEKDIEADYIEIKFKDQYIGRGDMFRLKNYLQNNCVYVGKRVLFSGCIRAQIKAIHYSNKWHSFGFITPQTKMIFRSESAKYFIFIQASSDLLRKENGIQLIMDGFLLELFQKWKNMNTNHVVSIVFTARMIYTEKDLEKFSELKDSTSPMPYQDQVVQTERHYYKDFYKVAFDWESRQEWQSIIPLLKKEANNFIKSITMNGYQVVGLLSHSSTGNLLESIHLALNIFSKHNIDRDLLRTGLSIVFVTASSGLFKVNKQLLRLTNERMMEDGIGLDLVCLSGPPLRVSPIFHVFPQNYEKSTNEKPKNNEPADPLYNDQDYSVFYSIPHWIDISFYCPYQLDESILVQTCAVANPIVPFLSPFITPDQYDEQVFQQNINPSHSPANRSPSKYTKSSLLSKNIMEFKRANRDRLSGEKLDQLSSSFPGNFPLSDTSQQMKSIDPCTPSTNQVQLSSHLRRWDHVFPQMQQQVWIKWYSLCTPACLPLTTDYFPSLDELSNHFQEYTYTVSINDDYIEVQNDPMADKRTENLLIELIAQRLVQGFQLKVDLPSNQKNVSSLSQKPIYLIMGSHIHRLFYDGQNVEVKRFVKKITYQTLPIQYTCQMWPKFHSGFRKRCAVFTYPDSSLYHWNYLDLVVSGYQEELTDNLRFWKSRFILIPFPVLPSSMVPFLNPSNEALNEEELRLAGLMKFLEFIHRFKCEDPNNNEIKKKPMKNQPLPITFTTLNLSTYVMNERAKQQTTPAQSLSNLDDSNLFNQLTRESSFQQLALAMQHPIYGLSTKDRRWHLRFYEKVFIGSECIDWFFKFLSDIDSREEAIAFGEKLLEENFLQHANRKHRFLDGHYFYRINKDYQTSQQPVKKESSGPMRWLRAATGSSSHLKNEEEKKPVEEAPIQFDKIILSKKIIIDVDQQQKSYRRELAHLHYDTVHNPKYCFHFQLHWLVCTARLVDDLLQQWNRVAEKCGFRLIEAPIDQAKKESVNDNPFQSPVSITLAVPPPNAAVSHLKLPEAYFEIQLLRHFGFLLDREAENRFPSEFIIASVPVFFQQTQFVHHSGCAFVQLWNDEPPVITFLWVNNRLYASHQNSKNADFQQPDALRNQFEAFCQNEKDLSQFWQETLMKLESEYGTGILSDEMTDEVAQKDQKWVINREAPNLAVPPSPLKIGKSPILKNQNHSDSAPASPSSGSKRFRALSVNASLQPILSPAHVFADVSSPDSPKGNFSLTPPDPFESPTLTTLRRRSSLQFGSTGRSRFKTVSASQSELEKLKKQGNSGELFKTTSETP